MNKHTSCYRLSLVITFLFTLSCFSIYAEDAPGKNTVETVPINADPFGNPPPPPPKKPKIDPPKVIPYSQLPLNELIEKANGNFIDAQFELALRYDAGRTVPKNTKLAMRWLHKAAAYEQPDAMRFLAAKLLDGGSYQEAIQWYEKLAGIGDIASMVTLGNIYANGEGISRNLPRAYTWFAIAAAGEKASEEDPQTTDEQIKENQIITSAEEERDRLGGLISERQLAQAQENAARWWEKHQARINALKAFKARKRALAEAAALAAQNARNR